MDVQNMAALEMEAYDSLPDDIRKVFDRAETYHKPMVLKAKRIPELRDAIKSGDVNEVERLLPLYFS